MTSAFSVERSRLISWFVTALCVASILSMACTKHTLVATPVTDVSAAVDGGFGPDLRGETAGVANTGGAAGTVGATETEGGVAPDSSIDVPAGPDGAAPCASGQKRCNGLCVATNDPKYGCDTATCDTSGCPAISGATLVCQGSMCVVGICGAGTKKCGDRCVDVNDSAYGCAASTCDSSTCPNPGPGGSVICQAGACVIATCGAGTKKCGARCVAVTDPTYGCGASTCDASACPNAGTGTLICQAGTCAVGSCGAGTKKCGDKCVPTDANNGCADVARCTPCASTEACVGIPVTQCQCVPSSMAIACAGKCGSVANGCGGNYTCATCTAPQTCSGGGVANVCGCTPNNTTACAGKACGPATNNCGQPVTCVDSCTGLNKCNGGTAGPNGCGCTPPVAMVAACAGKCDSVPNGCGGNYTCATCTAPQTCGGGGVANVCGCTPVAMTGACAGKCGSVPNGCGGTYTCSTCAVDQKCDIATSMCVANCAGVTCGANLKCDPATGGCVDICTGGGTGTPSHCCADRDCPAAPTCKVATCNPASRTCSTSTNKVLGASDSACPTSAASCQAGGCDGLGACLAAPAGTPCKPFTCSNSGPQIGQYGAVDHRQSVCNGALGATACQASANVGCVGNLVCADGVNCKTGCTIDRDCLRGNYCKAGVCTPWIPTGSATACAAHHECASRFCHAGMCTACDNRFVCVASPPQCSDDTQCIPPGAPMCSAGVCSCGAIDACPSPTICMLSAPSFGFVNKCAVPIALPCFQDSDCNSPASLCGTNGLCSPNPLGIGCAHDEDCMDPSTVCCTNFGSLNGGFVATFCDADCIPN